MFKFIGKAILWIITIAVFFLVFLLIYGYSKGMDPIETLFSLIPQLGQKFGQQYYAWKVFSGFF